MAAAKAEEEKKAMEEDAAETAAEMAAEHAAAAQAVKEETSRVAAETAAEAANAQVAADALQASGDAAATPWCWRASLRRPSLKLRPKNVVAGPILGVAAAGDARIY